MMTLVEDTEAGTLGGAVDGENRLYTTSQAMRLDRVVDVFINGLCLVQGVANGYDLTGPTAVTFREAPVPGDVVAVRYSANPIAVGVPDSQPLGMGVAVLAPSAPEAALDAPAGGLSQCVVAPATCGALVPPRPAAACSASPASLAQVVVRPC